MSASRGTFRTRCPQQPRSRTDWSTEATTGTWNDAPILAWFGTSRFGRAEEVDAGSVALPASEFHVKPPGRPLTSEGEPSASTAERCGMVGIVVATSTQDAGSVRATLLLIEGILAPIILLSLFTAATIIGAGLLRRSNENVAVSSSSPLMHLTSSGRRSASSRQKSGLALNSERTAAAYRMALERVSGESKRLRRNRGRSLVAGTP